VESSATSKRRLQAQGIRTGRESRLPREGEEKEKMETKDETGWWKQKMRQKIMLQRTKWKEVDVPAGRKDGGSVGMWKAS
jgi:hypothetical protein